MCGPYKVSQGQYLFTDRSDFETHVSKDQNSTKNKKSDRYLLTHQEQPQGSSQLKTTLVKGEIFDTKTGGIQVKFTGKEKLTTATPGSGTTPRTNNPRKRPSCENEQPESIESGFTDVNVRCGYAVEHHKGASNAHVTNAK